MAEDQRVGEQKNGNDLVRSVEVHGTTQWPKGAFGYYGSKQRLANSILKYLPPHHCWVELFGGALAVTMAKKPAMIEIVNDLDENIVNTFRQMRDNGDELLRLIELTPYARTETDERATGVGRRQRSRARKEIPRPSDDVGERCHGREAGRILRV